MRDVRVVKGELLVGKWSKAAKRLEIDPSEWESAVPVVVVCRACGAGGAGDACCIEGGWCRGCAGIISSACV